MDPHSHARAVVTTIMFGFIALYFVLGKTSWLDCLRRRRPARWTCSAPRTQSRSLSWSTTAARITARRAGVLRHVRAPEDLDAALQSRASRRSMKTMKVE